MNIKEIVEQYLRDNGYTGLCGFECGCGLDNLMPCNAPDISECVAAYKHTIDCNCDICVRYREIGEIFCLTKPLDTK